MASGQTSTYTFPYPLQTDAVDVAADIQALAQSVESATLLKAPSLSPALTGTPTAPTPNDADSTTKVATTEFVKNQNYLTTISAAGTYAPLISPTLTGVPLAPTASNGTNTTQIATTSFVQNALSTFVTLPTQTSNSGKFLTTNGTSASWVTIQQSDVSGLSTLFSTTLPATYAPLNMSINTRTAAYTLVLTDSAKQIEMNVATSNVLSIPTDASVAFPVGTTIVVFQLGAGQTTIAAVTPGTTTVVFTPGLKLRTQYSTATLVKRAANYWVVSGDLVA